MREKEEELGRGNLKPREKVEGMMGTNRSKFKEKNKSFFYINLLQLGLGEKVRLDAPL